MIHKQLRLRGLIIRTFLRPRNEKSFIRTNALLRRYLNWKYPLDLVVRECAIPREDGRQIRAIVCAPIQNIGQATGVLWLHGGGYAIGTPEQEFPYAQEILGIANAVIVIPDYRLSLDAPFPAALEDAYAALLWLKDNADSLGVNINQLFVAGQSAGGGLTAAVTALARDRGEVAVAFQMPLYPMLDDRMNTPSATNNNAPAWDSHSNRICWQMYLGDLFGTDKVPPYAAPARLSDFSNLPPTYTFVGDIEPFRDETVNYIKALRDAGVSAKVDVFEGCYHAFDIIGADKEIGKEATRRWVEEFKYAVGNHYAENQPRAI
ncbi:MAG: alpha/beta hydrolase [Coriobacteriaceae bacterium]|nr:alpha/beta hydrolase [Coriobacteriaceae bacterium]